MVDVLDKASVDAELDELMLDVEDLETLDAPRDDDFWSGVAGFLIGVGVGGLLVAAT